MRKRLLFGSDRYPIGPLTTHLGDNMSDKNAQDVDILSAPHMRLVALLRADGVPVGGAVPGEVELARRLGVGRQQVREALVVLEAFGAVRGRQGARRMWLGFNPATFGRERRQNR
jgi:DNA-binding FadR family transcriptional regulator